MRLTQRPVFWIGLTTAVRAVGTLAVQKYIAHLGGPAWVALLAHFQNLTALVTALPADGLGRSMKVQAGAEPGPKGRWVIYGQGLAFHIGAAALVALSGFLFLWLTPALFEGLPLWYPMLASVSMGLFLFFVWMGSVQQNQGRFISYFLYQAISVAAGLAALWLVPKHNISLALSIWLLCQGVVILPFVVRIGLRLGSLFKERLLQVDKAFLQKTGSFLLLGAGIALSGKAGDFFVREYALTRFSPTETGLWQAGVRLADVAYIPVHAYLSGVFFPHLARLQKHPVALGQAVRQQTWRLAVAGLPAYLLFAWAAPTLLAVFFTPAFSAGYDLLLLHLPGEFLRVLVLVPVYKLVARSQTRITLYLEFFSLGIYLLLLFMLLPFYGLYALPIAHTLRYAIYTAATFYWAGRPALTPLNS